MVSDSGEAAEGESCPRVRLRARVAGPHTRALPATLLGPVLLPLCLLSWHVLPFLQDAVWFVYCPRNALVLRKASRGRKPRVTAVRERKVLPGDAAGC